MSPLAKCLRQLRITLVRHVRDQKQLDRNSRWAPGRREDKHNIFINRFAVLKQTVAATNYQPINQRQWCNPSGRSDAERSLEPGAQYSDVIMSAMATQITGVSTVSSVVCSGAHQREHESSALLPSVRGIHRWPVDSPHKGPVTRKMLPFDDVITGKVIEWLQSELLYT